MTVQHSLGFHYSFVKSNSFVAMVILIIKGAKSINIYNNVLFVCIIMYYFDTPGGGKNRGKPEY